MVLGKRARSKVRFVHAVVVDPVRFRTQQRIVAIANQAYRQAAADMGDSRDLPTLGPAVRAAEEMLQGQLIVVADDKVVPDVKGGQSIAQGRIDRVNLFPQIGRIVERLAEGVPGRQLQSAIDMAQTE